MKKLLSFVAFLGIAALVNAQSFNVLMDFQTYQHGDTISQTLIFAETEIFPKIVNLSDQNINAQVVVTPIAAEGATVVSVCAGECTPGNSSPAFVINANSTYEGCDIAFEFESSADHSLFGITVKNLDNESGNTTVYVTFDREAGIQPIANVANLNLFPNPATDNMNISYSLPTSTQEAELMIVNTLGVVVKTVQLSGNDGMAQLSVSSLPAGVYTAIVKAGNAILGNSKMVVR